MTPTHGNVIAPVGSAIVFEVAITDANAPQHFEAPESDWPLLDPSFGVVVAFFHSAAAPKIYTAMTRIRQGIYRIHHQTGDADALGTWNADVWATHGDLAQPQKSQFYGVYELAAP